MVLLVFAVLGFIAGWRLGPDRHGFLAVAAISIASAVVQISHVLITVDRSRMTMLPLVAGTLVVVGLLAGALARKAPRNPNAA
jgi:CHASE2 domain-containing sensor protein